MTCESCEQRDAVGPVTVEGVEDGQTYLLWVCADCAPRVEATE